ncbi:MAG: hypothetical protein M1833_001897 [Piccolia ochrophora]|nr:MAG: hypothetical protein M1833_001897 [Piccolia ochrophora]
MSDVPLEFHFGTAAPTVCTASGRFDSPTPPSSPLFDTPGPGKAMAKSFTPINSTPNAPSPIESVTNEPPPPPISSTASALKRSFSAMATDTPTNATVRAKSTNNSPSPIPVPGTTIKPIAAHDPENHTIKHLREVCHMQWPAIASHLNAQRIAQGRVPSFTDNAVYSRYVRNAPRIAAARGEKFIGSLKAKNSSETVHEIVTGESADGAVKPVWLEPWVDELLVKAWKEVQGSVWDRVSDMVVELGGPKVEPADCARRFQML